MIQKVMKKALVLTLAICIALIMAQPAYAEDKPIVIGGSLPLTGKFAETAKWIEKGMKYWADGVINSDEVLSRSDTYFGDVLLREELACRLILIP